MKQSLAPLFLCGIILLASSRGVCAFKYVQPGMTAPTDRLVTLDGNDVDIESLYGQRGTLMLFWALWSPRSVQQLRDLAAQYDQLTAAGVQVVAVSVDEQEPGARVVDSVRHIRKAHDIRFPMLIDPGLRLYYAYGVVAVPSSAVVGPEGLVLYGLAGYSPYAADTMIGTTLSLLGVEGAGKVALPPMPAGKTYRFFGLGVKLYRQGKAQAALSPLQSATSEDSAFAPAQYYLALALQANGDQAAAGAVFARAVACDPANPVYRVAWAKNHLQAGDTASAVKLAQEALDIDTTYIEGWSVLAGVHLARGQLSEAASELARGHAVDPQSLELGLLEVQRLCAEGDTAQALSECQRLLRHRVGAD